MTEICKVKVNWTGFAGAPGYSNFYFNDFTDGTMTQTIANGAANKVDTWLGSVVALLPLAVTIAVDSAVEVIESTNGELQGFFNVAGLPVRTGNNVEPYSAASGACVNWYTGGVRNGRRVRGRTFIVPIGGESLATNGTIDDSKLTLLRTASTNLISDVGSGDHGVWSRPSGPSATDGEWFSTTAVTVNDKVAVLTSRRD